MHASLPVWYLGDVPLVTLAIAVGTAKAKLRRIEPSIPSAEARTAPKVVIDLAGLCSISGRGAAVWSRAGSSPP